MDLQDVRKFVRKGDDATKLLESLGYSYESYQNAPPKWIKVKADPLQSVYDSVGKLMGDLQAPLIAQIEEMTKAIEIRRQNPVKAGECFMIHPELIAMDHKLKREVPNWRGAIFKARMVEEDTPLGYAIVRFGPPDSIYNRGYWLPLEATIKL